MSANLDPHQLATLDQVGAAAEAATRLLDRAASRPGNLAVHSANLTRKVRAAWAAAGRLTTGCEHTPASPGVVYGLLSRPGAIYCRRCVAAAEAEDLAARPDVCDLCGETATGFLPVWFTFGPALVAASLCGSCLTHA